MTGETSPLWWFEVQQRLELSKQETEPGTLTQDMISRQTTVDTCFSLSSSTSLVLMPFDVVAQAMTSCWLHTGVRKITPKK